MRLVDPKRVILKALFVFADEEVRTEIAEEEVSAGVKIAINFLKLYKRKQFLNHLTSLHHTQRNSNLLPRCSMLSLAVLANIITEFSFHLT